MLKFHPLKVISKTEAAADAICIGFEVPPQLREQFRFQAGQHVAVRMVSGGEELRRTYSIVCPPDRGELRIGVRVQSAGKVSSVLARDVKIGDVLEVLTPNGSFHTRLEPERAKRYVAFAAGSGITPVLSIAATVLAQEPRSDFMLFYGNRTTATTMFLEEVLGLKNLHPARFAVHFVMSREPQELELLNGRLDRAKVREFARVFFQPETVDEYFICGPGTMVEEVHAALRELRAPGKVHTELFTTADRPVDVITAPRDVFESTHGLTQVAVIVDGRRRTFAMPRDGAPSVLDAAARAGIELPYSCRAGVCSTCRTRVVKGAVRMEHNQALEDWELDAGYVLCCQSRPTTAELELTYDE